MKFLPLMSSRALPTILAALCAALTTLTPQTSRADAADLSDDASIPRFTLTSKLLGIEPNSEPNPEESYRLRISRMPRSTIEDHLEDVEKSQDIASVVTQWVYPRLKMIGHRVTREGLTVAEFDEADETDDAHLIPSVSMNMLGARFRLEF